MKTKLVILICAATLFACNNNHEVSEYPNMEQSVYEDVVCNFTPAPPACSTAPLEVVKFTPPVIKDDEVVSGKPATEKKDVKKIIKDGNVSIKVKEIEKAKQSFDSLVKKCKAYYEEESFRNTDDRNIYNLKIRVPAAEFDLLVKNAEKGNGELISKSINARDVTEDYTDTEIRLNSKKLSRKRYNELLENALKMDDVLSIEENIRNLQEEIESQEGHIKYIDDQVAFSTLYVNLFSLKEHAPVQTQEIPFSQEIKNNLKAGWQSVISGLLWLISKWPWALAFITLSLLLRRWWKKRHVY